MNRNEDVLLAYEAKRRPILAEMLSRAEALTDAEIDSAPLPLLWMKNALRKRRDASQAQNKSLPIFADIEAAIKIGNSGQFSFHYRNDPDGIIFEWMAGDTWIQSSLKTKIQIRNGDLLFLSNDGEMWLDLSGIKPDNAILQNCRNLGSATLNAYREKCRNRFNENFGIPEEKISGFRIVRF